MIRQSHISSRTTGFTLLEVIVTLVIIGALGAMGATLMSRGFLNYFVAREISRDDAQGRLAFERMARELRTVRSTADLNIGVANQITITDFDQTVIVYRRNAGTSQLERSQDGGATFQPLADNVSTLTISYLQNDGTTAAAVAANVYYITVLLTIVSSNVNLTYRSTLKPAAF
jgi:prepilin-type N-terminal cleavage/methylation domain-containing protein